MYISARMHNHRYPSEENILPSFWWCHTSSNFHHIVHLYKTFSLLSGHCWGQMAVNWDEVTILRLICPGISSAICRPLFRSWSLWGLEESFAKPDNTTWPMNSSITALLFHTWRWPVSSKSMCCVSVTGTDTRGRLQASEQRAADCDLILLCDNVIRRRWYSGLLIAASNMLLSLCTHNLLWRISRMYYNYILRIWGST